MSQSAAAAAKQSGETDMSFFSRQVLLAVIAAWGMICGLILWGLDAPIGESRGPAASAENELGPVRPPPTRRTPRAAPRTFATVPADERRRELQPREPESRALSAAASFGLPNSTASMSIFDATRTGDLSASATGDGLEFVRVTVVSRRNRTWRVTIPAGTRFLSDGHVQNMISRGSLVFILEPGETTTFAVSVSCMNMHLPEPKSSDVLRLEPPESRGDLARLVATPSFANAAFRVQQFAVWTVTDNPGPGQFVGIGSSLSPFGSGPTDSEIAILRRLFYEAGIETTKYRVFGGTSRTSRSGSLRARHLFLTSRVERPARGKNVSACAEDERSFS